MSPSLSSCLGLLFDLEILKVFHVQANVFILVKSKDVTFFLRFNEKNWATSTCATSLLGLRKMVSELDGVFLFPELLSETTATGGLNKAYKPAVVSPFQDIFASI